MTKLVRTPPNLTEKSLLPADVLSEVLGADPELIQSLIDSGALAPATTICVPRPRSLYRLGAARSAIAEHNRKNSE